MERNTKIIETRKNEIRFMTNDPKEMVGKYLAQRLLHSWEEDFVDQDTGEVVTIKRNEVLMERGHLLDREATAKIQFYLQSGDIKEVDVSNQRREAFLQQSTFLYPWIVTIRNSDNKKKKFLLYASTMEMAIEVVKDYVELNFTQGFMLSNAREFDSCVILKDILKKYKPDQLLEVEDLEIVVDESDDYVDNKFYQIDVTVTADDYTLPQTFVVETKDAEKAIIVIKDYIIKENVKRDEPLENIEVKLETAKVLPCDSFIEREFSLAYSNS